MTDHKKHSGESVDKSHVDMDDPVNNFRALVLKPQMPVMETAHTNALVVSRNALVEQLAKSDERLAGLTTAISQQNSVMADKAAKHESDITTISSEVNELSKEAELYRFKMSAIELLLMHERATRGELHRAYTTQKCRNYETGSRKSNCGLMRIPKPMKPSITRCHSYSN